MTLRAVKACVLAPFLLLAGCSAFFGFNLLKGLDKVSAPDPSQYDYATNGAAGLQKLATDLGSQAIVNALIGDPQATNTIESNLQTTYTDPSVPVADRELAAALSGDINLKTTSGSAVVTNAVNLVLSGTSGQTVQQILQEVVPDNVKSDPTAFTNMVNGLLNACAAYQVLGNSLTPPQAPPPGVNMGDVAQKAAVAWTMQCVVTAVINANGGPPFSNAQAIDQMYLITNGQPGGITVPDPFSPVTPQNQWLSNIFTVAGATMPS